MLKEILYWTDEKFDEINKNPNEKHRYIKAFVLGCVEGALEGLVIVGAGYMAIEGIIAACNRNKK